MTRIPGKQFIGDFLDFVSGNYRSRIQAGTLTADRTLTAPDSTGTIALQTARSASIQNLGAGMPIFASAAPDSVASIATPVQIRTAAAITDLATQQPNNVNITGGGITNINLSALVAGSPFEALDSHVDVGSMIDRFAGIDRICNVTYTHSNPATPAIHPQSLWDTSGDSFCAITAGESLTIEIDFHPINGWSANTNSGYTYGIGALDVVVYDVDAPASVTWDFYRPVNGVDQWETAATMTTFANYARNSVPAPNVIFVKQARITIQAGAGICRIAKLRYAPSRTDTYEQPTPLLNSAGASQRCHTQISVQDIGGSSATTIGPGTLRINTGATLTAMLRATKTIAGTNPETITVTGAAVGDIVELSRPIVGEVTAANTVTFNGTGLTGDLTAIVKRYA
jgi:hypothetical protein